MARREISHKVDVTGLTEAQYKQVRGKFMEAIGRIENLVGRHLATNERLKKAEAKAAGQKTFHDQVAKRKELDEAGRAIRRQAACTGWSPEALKAKVEKEEKEREASVRIKQEEEQWRSDHPELYDKDGEFIDDNDEGYSNPFPVQR